MLARAAIRDVGRVLGMRLRRGRPHRQGRPEPARASGWRRRSRRRRELEGHVRRGSDGRTADRTRPAARRRGPQRVHACGGRRHLPRAADRADAAPEGDELRRAHDAVRDARRRVAGPAQVRLPGSVEPHDPAPGGGPGPSDTRRSRSISSDPARRRARPSSCWPRARRPAYSSWSRRACAATSAS